MGSGVKTIAMFLRYVQSTREDIGRKDVEKELAMLPQGEAIMKTFEEEYFPKAYQQGVQQVIHVAHGFLLTLLREKAGSVPREVEEKVRRIENPAILERLGLDIMHVATVEEFEALLDSALGGKPQ